MNEEEIIIFSFDTTVYKLCFNCCKKIYRDHCINTNAYNSRIYCSDFCRTDYYSAREESKRKKRDIALWQLNNLIKPYEKIHGEVEV